jgi:outer membrane protein OmpA-like peptidoglycan-associated protein
MRSPFALIALALWALAIPAAAQELSTSIMRPSSVNPSTGIIAGKLPGSAGPKSYYVSIALEVGALTTQLQISGHPNAQRLLTLQLLDAKAGVADSAFVRAGFGAKDEKTKAFAIDAAGRYLLRLTVEGDETGSFCVLMGGPALPTAHAAGCSEPAAAPAPPASGAPPGPAASTAAESRAVLPAEELSTSIVRPSPIEPRSGVITGRMPGGEAAKTYYLAADLNAGSLLTQIEIAGRSNAGRRVTLELLGEGAGVADSTFVRSSFGTKDEVTRAFAIDASGRHVLRLIVEGEETGTFCLLLGGTALPHSKPQFCPSDAPTLGSAIGAFSPSIMQPSPIDPATGRIVGKLPGGEAVQFYYFAADLFAGQLTTQLQIAGRSNASRRLTLQLLAADARVAESVFVRSGFGSSDETTRTFAIEASGRHILRLILEGEETGSFCVLLGGSALPSATAPSCPTAGGTVAAAVSEKSVEVLVSKCEERLRVGSDFLFDFDRAEIRPEAAPALTEVARHVAAATRKAMIEGHTDAKGTDSYNQALSERRAQAVRTALVALGLPETRLAVRGFGKSRPVAPNQHPDGSDDPEARQKNRRVEIVLATCR